jgi:hypothetical protein
MLPKCRHGWSRSHCGRRRYLCNNTAATSRLSCRPEWRRRRRRKGRHKRSRLTKGRVWRSRTAPSSVGSASNVGLHHCCATECCPAVTATATAATTSTTECRRGVWRWWRTTKPIWRGSGRRKRIVQPTASHHGWRRTASTSTSTPSPTATKSRRAECVTLIRWSGKRIALIRCAAKCIRLIRWNVASATASTTS